LHPAAASSSAASATAAPSTLGFPASAEKSPAPTATPGTPKLSTHRAGPIGTTRPTSPGFAFNHAATTSGPTPAGSPHVTAKGLFSFAAIFSSFPFVIFLHPVNLVNPVQKLLLPISFILLILSKNSFLFFASPAFFLVHPSFSLTLFRKTLLPLLHRP
jgi:hypothetical protein